MQATGTAAYNVLQNNGMMAHQAVPHVHFHIIPRPSELKGLGIRWPAGKLDHETGQVLARKIAELLETR
jgi:diadenosine tetraphosphate (Ap4A) HIT family hydrolase